MIAAVLVAQTLMILLLGRHLWQQRRIRRAIDRREAEYRALVGESRRRSALLRDLLADVRGRPEQSDQGTTTPAASDKSARPASDPIASMLSPAESIPLGLASTEQIMRELQGRPIAIYCVCSPGGGYNENILVLRWARLELESAIRNMETK